MLTYSQVYDVYGNALGTHLRLWDPGTGKVLVTKGGASRPVAFSRDGSRVVSSDGGEYISKGAVIWDAKTGEDLARIDGGRVGSVPYQVRSDGRLGAQKVLWDAATGKPTGAEAELPFEGWIVSDYVELGPDSGWWVGDYLEPGPDGKRLLEAAYIGKTREKGGVAVWDLSGGPPVFSAWRECYAGAPVAAISPDGKRVAVGWHQHGPDETVVYEIGAAPARPAAGPDVAPDAKPGDPAPVPDSSDDAAAPK